MRCPMTNVSRFAYKAKPKQCLGQAEMRVCIPGEVKPTYTEVFFPRICASCALTLLKAKSQAKAKVRDALMRQHQSLNLALERK